ncbi:MAG: alpha/beta hydrolase [Hamadaea sp.]|uniref:alpha/beta fold hydrolase n=1 Tax=Hamadaea sp. TaxID=2024425 RepID=UPI001838A316|nr:alpha/beta hydrolase [Hamadaea sp.]NUR70344.1 alpha/beta hydrolase [Hamadaea sp.]NUT21934.1 alpha/beta hydrolase [Hamadaea sp.]
MTDFVLIPGADGQAWYWHRVLPLLQAEGHDAVAVDLPQSDDAGYDEYAEAIHQAMIGRPNPVLVAQSLAGFLAPVVAARTPVAGIVLVNAMVPAPGESAGEWWANVGHDEARQGRQFDLLEDFFHDVPAEITAEATSRTPTGPSERLFTQPWPLSSWPDVPTTFLQGVDDRFFPLEFQRRLVRRRLGLDVVEIPGGHLGALSCPESLANHLTKWSG